MDEINFYKQERRKNIKWWESYLAWIVSATAVILIALFTYYSFPVAVVLWGFTGFFAMLFATAWAIWVLVGKPVI